jgi:hypothetical protein
VNFRPVISTEASKPIRNLPALAVDLGFAEKAASCGLSEQKQGLKFADAVSETAAWLSRQEDDVVLILEAPISGSFDVHGNPCARGKFETHHSVSGESCERRWQSGAGASMALAALHFLRLLREKVEAPKEVHLVEGFCSRYGAKKPSDTAVANELLRLWRNDAPLLQPGGATTLSTLWILDSHVIETPPAILCVPDGFC